jgi:PAS domain S-box-containing protein
MDSPRDDNGLRVEADDLQEVVALCDEDGILLSWNKAGEDVTGFSREDVVGYHMDAIVAPGSRDTLNRILGIQRTGSVLPGVSMRLQTSFGMEVPVEVTTVPRRVAGSPAGWLLIFRDATLKVQLQEHLDKMETLYRRLVECSPDIIYVLDPQAKVVFINDTVETLLGYEKKDLLGKELIDIVHPQDRERAYWPLKERRRDDRATRNLRLRLLTKAGAPRRYDLEFIYISLSAMGLGPQARAGRPGQADEPVGTQGVAHDVTELAILQEFSRQVELILPICSVCRKIRVSAGAGEEWVPMSEYVARKTGVLFSHTYCPDHLPAVE